MKTEITKIYETEIGKEWKIRVRSLDDEELNELYESVTDEKKTKI